MLQINVTAAAGMGIPIGMGTVIPHGLMGISEQISLIGVSKLRLNVPLDNPVISGTIKRFKYDAGLNVIVNVKQSNVELTLAAISDTKLSQNRHDLYFYISGWRTAWGSPSQSTCLVWGFPLLFLWVCRYGH